MRHAYVGMPREPLEMPNEDNAVRSMQSRRSRIHVASLPRFALEERAPFTNEGTFGADATRSRSRAYP